MGISSVSQQEDRRPVILVPLMRRECPTQVLLHRLRVALHHGFGLCVQVCRPSFADTSLSRTFYIDLDQRLRPCSLRSLLKKKRFITTTLANVHASWFVKAQNSEYLVKYSMATTRFQFLSSLSGKGPAMLIAILSISPPTLHSCIGSRVLVLEPPFAAQLSQLLRTLSPSP